MRRQKNSLKKFLFIILVLVIAAAGGFIYLSPQFEQNAPKVTLSSNSFWNLKDDLEFNLSDKSGIKSYSVYYKINDQITYLNGKKLDTNQNSINLKVKTPNIATGLSKITIIVEAVDNSKWNFFQGNKTKKEFELNIDTKKPIAEVLVNSYNIRRGGSAAVVVKVKDDNLSEKYISFNGKYKFELIPYLKKDYYAAIIAWPVWEEDFKRVSLIAIDKANNKTNTKVPLYIKDLKVKKDTIKISKNFINKVSIPVLKKSDFSVPQDNIAVFVKQNRELRLKNINTIKQESVKNMSKEMIKNFKIKPFKRLKNSKTFAGFAEKRQYFYEGEKIDQAWHLGMDWASIKHAKIRVSNSGKVIFNSFLGIYGNTLIIDHGFGLQSLYAHTSKFNVQKDDKVKAGAYIANTGNTGAVFGDHLHFGVLVQGIEVNPLEWMDKNWIKTRVFNILDEAKQLIRSSK